MAASVHAHLYTVSAGMLFGLPPSLTWQPSVTKGAQESPWHHQIVDADERE